MAHRRREQVLVEADGRSRVLEVEQESTVEGLRRLIYDQLCIGPVQGYEKWREGSRLVTTGGKPVTQVERYISVLVRGVGGIDFQNRAGSKPGSGGVASSEQAAIDRRERLRKLALETVDLNKDPYFMRNHVGTFECKLCLTLHNTEANYLSHTQGKRHQQNLARRALKQASTQPTLQPVSQAEAYVEEVRSGGIKIGRPGYKVTKSRDPQTNQRTLLFEIDYPEADAEIVQPRHRFMSAFEQRLEPPDKNYQYILFACEPYETIAFKIPNDDIDKDPIRFFTNWHAPTKHFSLSLQFKDNSQSASNGDAPPSDSAAKQHRPTLHFHTSY